MKDLGIFHYSLGLQVLPLSYGFFISQSKYVMNLLNFFKMAYCKPYAIPFQSRINLSKACQTLKVNATLYRQLVSSISYLTHSRTDISFDVSVVSHFMQDPIENHLKEVNKIIRYLKGTTHIGIKYCCSLDSLASFTDSDWVGENDD